MPIVFFFFSLSYVYFEKIQVHTLELMTVNEITYKIETSITQPIIQRCSIQIPLVTRTVAQVATTMAHYQ